ERLAHADRLADVVHGHGDLDRAIHRHFLQVHVHEALRDRVVLHVADDRHARLIGVGERHAQELRAALAAVDDAIDVLRRHRDVPRLGAAVEDGRHLSGPAEAPRRALADAVALADRELTHVHDGSAPSSELYRKWGLIPVTRTGATPTPRRGCG